MARSNSSGSHQNLRAGLQRGNGWTTLTRKVAMRFNGGTQTKRKSNMQRRKKLVYRPSSIISAWGYITPVSEQLTMGSSSAPQWINDSYNMVQQQWIDGHYNKGCNEIY